MRPRNIPIRRQILIQPRQNLLTPRRIAPIPHQIHHNGKNPLQHHPRILHPRVRIIRQLLRERPTPFRIRKHRVPFRAEGERQELGADVRGDAGEDDLRFIGGADGGAEIGVVPGVDFAVAADEGGGRVHLGDFFGEGAVGSRFGGGGEDDGEGEEGGDGGVGEDVVAVGDGVEVVDLLGVCFCWWGVFFVIVVGKGG